MRKSQRILGLRVSVLLVLVGCPWNSKNFIHADEPAAGPLSGRLVFFGCVDEATSQSRVVSILPDGTDRRIDLMFDRPMVGLGKVAPNADTFVFSAQDATDGDVRTYSEWIKEPNEEPRRLAESNGGICAWDPQGELVLAYLGTEGRYENQLINATTGEVEILELDDTSAVQAFTHDGTSLIVIAMNPDRSYADPVRGEYPLRQLFLWDRDSHEQTIFTDPEHDCIWPAVSPEGDQIAFYLRRHVGRPLEYLAIADANGENGHEVFKLNEVSETTVIRPIGFPQWSPDGTEIAWLRTVTDLASNKTACEILFIAADGSSSRRLPLGPFSEWGHLQWVR